MANNYNVKIVQALTGLSILISHNCHIKSHKSWAKICGSRKQESLIFEACCQVARGNGLPPMSVAVFSASLVHQEQQDYNPKAVYLCLFEVTYPEVSPYRCLHSGSSLYSG